MSAKSLIVLLISTVLLSVGCVKNEYVLDENTVVPGLEPEFAIPLASSDIGLNELIESLDFTDEVQNAPGSQLALTFRERLFEIGLEDLVQLPPQEVQETYEADAITAALFNATIAGAELPITQIYNLPFEFENGEELDSIRLGQSTLSISLLSIFRHDLNVTLTIPELKYQSEIFSTEFDLDYSGSLPVTTEIEIDVTDHLLDFTDPGNNNELNIVADFIITHSGEFTNVGDSLFFDLALSSNSLKAAYGYLGQFSGIAEIDTQRVDVFADIDAESLFFADPAIELDIYNSSGIPMEIDFSSLFAPQNSVTQLITGGALEEIPIVQAAVQPGEVALTEHRIDNSNTSPPLSDMLSEGPVDLIYTAEGTTNPEGYAYNFILDTSKVSCDATVILPLYGSIDGYHLQDTLEIDMETDLGLSDDGFLTIDDIENVQLRIIADNGLPIETRLQVVFLDSLSNATDSLFLSQIDVPIISAGVVDHSLPISHPDHGRVIAPTRAVTDVVMSRSRLEQLIDGDIKYLAIKLVGNTDEAGDGELVKFYPEDRFKLKLSAKLETEIDISE